MSRNSELIRDELKAMLDLKMIGKKRYDKAIAYVDANPDEIADYSAMRSAEMADLVLEVSNIN